MQQDCYKSGMDFLSGHYEKLIETLTWRRDVRHFQTEPVDPDIIAAIEAAVDLAPSVGNSRPWRFIRVKTPDKRAAIIRSYNEAKEAAGRIYNDQERRKYDALKLAGLVEAPVHLAVFTDLTPSQGRGLGRQTMPETLLYSTVMAIHTLWLTARTLNVGVGWVSILEPQEVSQILGAPEGWQLTGYLCLGYPQESNNMPELHRKDWQHNTKAVWIDR